MLASLNMMSISSSLCYLLLVGFAQAADVYLSSSQSFSSQLSLQRAGVVLSEYLGLDAFENLQNYGDFGEREFVGQGPSNALFLLVDDATVQGLFPTQAISPR